MIYTAPYVILLMRTNPSRGQVGGRLGPGNQDFLGPVKWHRAVRRVLFGAQKVEISRPNPLPLVQGIDFPASKAFRTGPYQSEVHR